MKSNSPVVLVTGCASGIGLELAKALYARSDLKTIITSRVRHLEGLKSQFKESDSFKIRELDIADDENIYRLVHEACRDFGRIDVIVNNAAVCYRGVIEHMDSESEMVQLKTNYLGPMSLIRAVLPIMREQRSGQIINVSSASGIMAMPTMGSYSASKHALEGATEALWYEAKPFGIKVNLIELGFVNSSSFQNVVLSNKAKISTALEGPHSEYYRSMTPFIERFMKLSLSSPQNIAQKILKTIVKPPDSLRVAATLDVFIFEALRRLMPSSVFHRLLFALLPGSIKWGGRWKSKKPRLATQNSPVELLPIRHLK